MLAFCCCNCSVFEDDESALIVSDCLRVEDTIQNSTVMDNILDASTEDYTNSACFNEELNATSAETTSNQQSASEKEPLLSKNLNCPVGACRWSGGLRNLPKHLQICHAHLFIRSHRFLLSKDMQEIRFLTVSDRYFLLWVDTQENFSFMLFHLDEYDSVECDITLSDPDFTIKTRLSKTCTSHTIWEQAKSGSDIVVFHSANTLKALKEPQEIMCYCDFRVFDITYGLENIHWCFLFYNSAPEGLRKQCRVYGSFEDFVAHLQTHPSLKVFGKDFIPSYVNEDMYIMIAHGVAFLCVESEERKQFEMYFDVLYYYSVNIRFTECGEQSNRLTKKLYNQFVVYCFEWCLQQYNVIVTRRTKSNTR